MDVYYSKGDVGYNMYIISDNYNHSLEQVNQTIAYAKSIGCSIPSDNDIRIEILTGERYSRMMSVEFYSITKPNEGTKLTSKSSLWNWLKY